MSTADQLLELMFSWIEKKELCAKQLKKLACELESLREKCNISECFGTTTSVLGAACLIGAGTATLLTGGAAAPVLGVLGAVYSGLGVTVSVVTKITEHFLSSDTMKEAQDVEKQSSDIEQKLQQLFEQLKAEKGSSCAEEVDRHVLTEILGAMARRSGLMWRINICTLDDKLRFFFDTGLGNVRLNQTFNHTVMAGFAGILTFFTFELSGKEFKFLFAQGTKQFIKGLSTTGFKSVLKGGSMVVGGAVGMAFALPEAIDSWKELVEKNHVTEVSKSLRDTAEDILTITNTPKQHLEDLKRMFDEMAESRQEEDEENEQEEEESDFEDDENEQEEEESDFEDEEKEQEEEESDFEDEEKEQEEEESDFEDEESEQEEEESSDESEDDEDGQTGRKRKTKRRQQKQTKSERRGESDANQSAPAEIRVGLLNVRSMNNKPSRILDLITQTNRNVFLTTETWSREDTADSVLTQASPENFGFNQWVRAGRGGGVATQFLIDLGGERVDFGPMTSFEYVATLLQHPEWDQPILVINTYLPPGYNQERFRTFLNEFQQLLDDASKEYSSILVTGDFNIKVDPERRSYTDEFYFLLGVNDLVQHVQEPTHQRGNMLDLVITRNVHIISSLHHLFQCQAGIRRHRQGHQRGPG